MKISKFVHAQIDLKILKKFDSSVFSKVRFFLCPCFHYSFPTDSWLCFNTGKCVSQHLSLNWTAFEMKNYPIVFFFDFLYAGGFGPIFWPAGLMH